MADDGRPASDCDWMRKKKWAAMLNGGADD
jgi:hypothetical protein